MVLMLRFASKCTFISSLLKYIFQKRKKKREKKKKKAIELAGFRKKARRNGINEGF